MVRETVILYNRKDNVNDTLCVPNFGTFLMRKIQKTKMSVDVTGKGKRAMV